MKFWKHTLITAIAFFSIAAMVFYTACTKDPCNTLVCKNGGACVSGLCQCPAGYEDAECGTRSVLRYLGHYTGYTTCNSTITVADTVDIYPTTDSVDVAVIQHSNISDTLIGTVSTNPSGTGSITIPTDSISNYTRSVVITLNANQLSIFSTQITNGDLSSKVNCTFSGSK